MTDTAARPTAPVQSTRAGRTGTARSRRPPAVLVVPAAAVAVAMLLPLAYLLIRAAGAGERAVDLLTAPLTGTVLLNTALLAGIVTVLAVAVAVPLAWVTTRADLPARRVWAVLATLPLVIPTFVGGFAYVAAFGPRGMLQALLAPLGVQRLPEIYGLPGAVLALTLFTYPYLLLTVRGALLGMDPAQEEASRSLGRGPLRTFLAVTLPQLRPAIAAGSLLVALYVLSDFGAVSLLRFDSFTRVIYLQYLGAFDRTPAAVLAIVLVALTIALLVGEAWTRGRRGYARAGAGSQREPPVVALGRWRAPAVAFCGVVVLLALVVPLMVIAFWLVRGLGAGEPLRLVLEAAWNSVRASGAAAATAAVASLPVAVLSVRHRGRLSLLLERATYVGYALPGIVIALALVFFGTRYGGALYQTLPLLVFAYVVRFLPQSVGATRASVLQVPRSVEDAARGLGRGSATVLLEITAPLVRPGVLAGAALVFLTAMKELPATLLLSPAGFPTLATTIWGATSQAYFAQAAAPALLLIALSGAPMAVLLTRRGLLGSAP